MSSTTYVANCNDVEVVEILSELATWPASLLLKEWLASKKLHIVAAGNSC